MLAVFLNRCRAMKDVLEDGVFWRFLDPHTSWVKQFRQDLPPPYTLTPFPERGPEQRASRQHPQADPEGSSARHRKPYASAWLPPRPLLIRKAQVCRSDLQLRHTHISTQPRCIAFRCRAHHTWTASLWSVSPGDAGSVRRRAGSVLCELRAVIKRTRAAATRSDGEGQ